MIPSARIAGSTTRVALLALGATLALACTDIGSDPSTPTSVEFGALPGPSIVLGDTLRDSLGRATRVTARVFGPKGNEIPDAPLTIAIIDTATGLAVGDGYIVSDSALRGASVRTARVQIQAGRIVPPVLQLALVFAPDSMGVVDTIKTVTLAADTTVSDELRVKLLYDSVGTPKPVPSYLVRFTVLYPASTLTRAVDPVTDLNRVAAYDTTASDGTAGRRLRLLRGTATAGTDSVLVEARTLVRGQVGPTDTLVLRVRRSAAGTR